MQSIRYLCGSAALVTLTAMPIRAQEESGNLSVGGAVALISSTLAGSDLLGVKRAITFSAGGITERTSERRFFRTGLVFAKRGANLSNSGFDYSIRLSYLEIPVVFGFEFPRESSTLRPYTLVGAHVGIQVGCRIAITSGASPASGDCEESTPPPELSPIDVALLAGGGIAITRGKWTVRTEAAYAHGLLRYQKDSDSRNRGLSLGLISTIQVR